MPLPTPDRLLQTLDRFAGAIGVGNASLDPGGLLATALRRSRRREFRDPSFVPALRLLLECCEKEADLSLFGRYAAKWDVLRCLSNLLRFEAEEERNPHIARENIERPIFVTGLPRSGTSLLHSLLTTDASLRVPRCWQTISPYPNKRRDRRRQNVNRQLRIFQRLAPEMSALHPLSAESPQECTEITAQVFQSLRYEMTYRIPSYQAWIDAAGHIPAYRFHKRFLQHLQHQERGGHWVLKCPDHVHALNAIERIYPDCGIVFVHRDPLRVIASAAKLTEVVRRPFSRHIDKKDIGRQVLARLIEGADTMIERSKADRRIFHLRYTDFAREPLRQTELLYRHFGLPLGDATRQSMRMFLAAAPPANHRYSLEEFGFDSGALRDHFECYMEHFDIQRESPLWQTRTSLKIPIAA
jgi:hypothetical protein